MVLLLQKNQYFLIHRRAFGTRKNLTSNPRQSDSWGVIYYGSIGYQYVRCIMAYDLSPKTLSPKKMFVGIADKLSIIIGVQVAARRRKHFILQLPFESVYTRCEYIFRPDTILAFVMTTHL